MLRAFAPGEMTDMVTMTGARWWMAFVLVPALALPAVARADGFTDMVAAERAFAADALARNMRDAFLATARMADHLDQVTVYYGVVGWPSEDAGRSDV